MTIEPAQPQRPDQIFTPPPPSTVAPGPSAVVQAQIVIVFGPAGKISGVFVYAAGTTPAKGNPPIAAITNGTVDPYTNVIESSITSNEISLGEIVQILQLSGATLNVTLPGTSVLPTQVGQLSTNAQSAFLLAGTENSSDVQGGLYVFSATTGNLPTAVISAILSTANPAVGGDTAEPWHTLSLSSGWSAGTDFNSTTYTPQYKLLPDGRVAFRGVLVTPSTGSVTGVTFATVGANYSPPTGGNIAAAPILQKTAANAGFVIIRPNGNVQLEGGSLSTSLSMYLDGATIPIQ